MLLCFWFLSLLYSTFSVNSLKIIFRWSLPLTSMNFSIHQASLMLLTLLLFYSHLLAASLNWSKVASKFLQFANNHIHVEVTFMKNQPLCKIVNWRSCKILFYADAKVVIWVKSYLEKVGNEFHLKLKKCVK